MLNYLILFLISLLLSFNLFAGNSINPLYKKSSPFAIELINDLDNNNIDMIKSKFVTVLINDKLYIPSLIKIASENSNKSDYSLIADKLSKKGMIISVKAGDIWSVKIPLDNLNKIISSPEVEYLQIDKPFSIHLNRVNQSLESDAFHFAEQINEQYRGKDVLVGVIDFGFDLTHSFFKDENGQTRIKKAWFQTKQTNNPPKGFNYGQEIEVSDFANIGTDSYLISHGSHVTGIAAGGFRQQIQSFRGIAPEADIILVSPNILTDNLISTSSPHILDAIKYIFDYANSVNKAVVINISLGTSYGPHDGSGLFDQACDNLLKGNAGKILVTSAGNDGHHNFVVRKEIGEQVKTIFKGSESREFLDIWGDKNSEFCIEMGIWENGKETWGKKYCTSSDDYISNKRIYYSSGNFVYGMSIKRKSFNGKPRILVNYIMQKKKFGIMRITNASGDLTMWHCGAGGSTSGEFSDSLVFINSGFTMADAISSVTEIGGNAKSFITVGSSNILRHPSNSNGAFGRINDISKFSAIGPSIDGRIKPEIVTAGSSINSSLNSYQSEETKKKEFISGKDQYGYPYGYKAGTSMSSPVVAGAIALLLEVNPYFDTDDIREILSQSAKSDSYTGKTPNPSWGYGKLDINNALQYAQKNITKDFNLVSPNPFYYYLKYGITKKNINEIKYQVYDLMGNLIYDKSEKVSDELELISIDGRKLAVGIYIMKIEELKDDKVKASNIIKIIKAE